MIIDVKITGQLLEAEMSPLLAEKSRGAHFCRVTADDAWAGMAMRLIYRNVTAAGEISREQIVTDRSAVPVPDDVLRAGRLFIGAVGLADDGYQRLTTADMRVGLKVWPVALLEATAGEKLTASQYEELVAVFQLNRNLLEQVNNNIGDVSNLDTESKTIVSSINELCGQLEPMIRHQVVARSALGVDYTAEVEGLDPVDGTEIRLLPQSSNQDSPTLSINGGEAYPLCLRPGWNVTGDDLRPQLTLPLAAGMLLRGAEYAFRFDGVAWILQTNIARKKELNKSAIELLLTILKNGIYISNQSDNILRLEIELSGQSLDTLITQSGNVVTIGKLADINVVQSSEALIIS